MQKKIIALLLILSFILCTGCSDKQSGISLSDSFPVSAVEFQAMLDEMEMDFRFEENFESDISEGYTCYELFTDELDTEEFFFTAVSTTLTDDMRYAGASFQSPGPYNKNVCSLEDYSEMIVLVTKTLGVFADENVVYEQFIEEFPEKNTEVKFYGYEYSDNAHETYTWKKNIAGVDCKVVVQKLNSDDAEPAITTIQLSYTIAK